MMTNKENVVKAINICLGHGKCNDCPYCFNGKEYTIMNCRKYMLRDALALLKEQETIVRCKDCKYWHDPIRCQLDSEGLKNPDDWYCADGKRRDNND